MSDEVLYLDIETYCDLELKKTTVYRYAAHPSFEILMCAWAYGDDPVVVETDPADIFLIPGLYDPDTVKVAHNAAFERVCFSRFGGLPEGTYLDPAPWLDTMAVARELGLPAKLDMLAKALGGEQKDTAGTRLINLFSKPYRGRRVRPEEKPEEWERFKLYNAQDVETMRDAHKRIGGMPTNRERQIYLADQDINDRGIRVDRELAQAARRAALANNEIHQREFIELSGVQNPNSHPQVMEWARGRGLRLPDLKAETIESVLARPTLDPVDRRVLELRQELALVAAKKFGTALLSINSDDRLRGSLSFHGAHTGRWAGRGVQPHNLPRASFYDSDGHYDQAQETDAVLELLTEGTADPQTLKRLVRPMFVGPLGVVDYASIEARVVAWLAGEEWALDAFYKGRDIYVETAERMSTPTNQLSRAQGKVAVLALGYQGAVGSLEVMGATGTEEELLRLVFQWRKANPNIVRFWHRLDEAFRIGQGKVGRITVERNGNDRALLLPSGRRLHYHDVKPDRRITFKDWSRNGWRSDTYGGRLTENVTQAVARDILGEALVRLLREGYPVVSHVHDEVLVDLSQYPSRDERTIHDIIEIMVQPPRWAKGLPIDAEGFICHRYRKG